MERLQLRSETSALELTIVNYQFPSPDEEGDAEWLVAELTVAHGGETFARRDPALETSDLETLEGFLRKGVEHADVFLDWQRPRLSSRLEFTEPNIAFELSSGPGMFLRVHLAYEFLPPFASDLQYSRWMPADGSRKTREEISSAWIDFPITASHLRELADVVGVWRAAFPVRRPSA
jgi:hypothetical protein